MGLALTADADNVILRDVQLDIMEENLGNKIILWMEAELEKRCLML